MDFKVKIKFAVILIISVSLTTNLIGQVRNDVIKVYNEGAKVMQTDIKAAISSFENVITLSDQVGEAAADLKQKAVQVLPGLYFKIAYNSLNEKKPVSETILAAKTAIVASDKYASATNKENSERVLAQAYNILANDFFVRNDLKNALLTYDSLLVVNPNSLASIYNKALIYKKQNNANALEEMINLYLGKLESGKDDEKAKQASSLALGYFRGAGSQANQADSLDKALILLNKAAKYGDDKDLFYYFADVYNKKKNFDKGAEYANKGLALEPGTAEAKAKFYFQIALAQAGKGQTADACTTFKNAMYGAFAEPSKVQRANLKCK